jgi:hypothetical protein
MKYKIRIEQGFDIFNISRVSRVEVIKGKIAYAEGISGQTQFEDRACFSPVNLDVFHLPAFIWMHYFAVILIVEGDRSTRLSFVDHAQKIDIGIAEITDMPKTITVNSQAAFTVFLHHELETGRFDIEPDHVIAGDEERFHITYTCGIHGMTTGGSVCLITPYSNWSPPACVDDQVTISTSTHQKVACEVSTSPYPLAVRGHVLKIAITMGDLVQGDTVTIPYEGSNQTGIRTQEYIQDEVYFVALEDSAGYGVYQPVPLDKCARVKVVAGDPYRFRLVTQQNVQAAVPFDVQIRVLDRKMNPVSGITTTAVLMVENSGGETIWSETLKSTGVGTSIQVPRLESGLYIVCIQAPGFREERLPIRVMDNPEYFHFFGQIHGHSAVSDGLFSQQDYFDYGREIGLLDFCALSDHDWELLEHQRNKNGRGVNELLSITRRLNQDGRFVTLCGYEWMGDEGHINVYFLDEDVCEVRPGKVTLLHSHERSESMRDLVDFFSDRQDVVLIPHFSHGFTWSVEPETEILPVAEVYSQWGSSENKSTNGKRDGGRQMLDSGVRFGFIGGSDSHHGMPGQCGYSSKYYTLNDREGLACVLAPCLSRSDLFDAIRARRTYAVTGERMLIDFKLQGISMGGALKDRLKERLTATVVAGGTAPLEKIEIIAHGGEVSAIYEPQGDMILERTLTIRRVPADVEYYYLRVTQKDGEMAISSPIWVDA